MNAVAASASEVGFFSPLPAWFPFSSCPVPVLFPCRSCLRSVCYPGRLVMIGSMEQKSSSLPCSTVFVRLCPSLSVSVLCPLGIVGSRSVVGIEFSVLELLLRSLLRFFFRAVLGLRQGQKCTVVFGIVRSLTKNSVVFCLVGWAAALYDNCGLDRVEGVLSDKLIIPTFFPHHSQVVPTLVWYRIYKLSLKRSSAGFQQLGRGYSDVVQRWGSTVGLTFVVDGDLGALLLLVMSSGSFASENTGTSGTALPGQHRYAPDCQGSEKVIRKVGHKIHKFRLKSSYAGSRIGLSEKPTIFRGKVPPKNSTYVGMVFGLAVGYAYSLGIFSWEVIR